MELVTIPHVPICRTGSYELSSGSVNFNADHFAAAVEAFENDPAVLAPRIRVVEHLDAEGIAVEASGGQGGPALGWADGLSTDGNTLYGDLHVPAELAEWMEVAFPGRSIEGLFGWNTATGHTHDFVATGLCLLGTDWPGVTTLPDFRELESEFATEVLAAGAAETPVMVVAPDDARPLAVAASVRRDGQPMLDRVAQAGLSVFDLSARWYGAEESGDLEGLPDSYSYWSWYVSEVRADDGGALYVVVYDDATGDQWRFDVTGIDGSTVTFGPPQPGGMDWRGATAAAIASAAPWARTPRPALARWRTREESRTASASTPTPPQEDDRPMDDAQRRALAVSMGLSPDTTEADLHTEAARRAAEADPAPVTAPEAPTPAAPVVTPTGDPVEPATPAVTIDSGRLAELEAAAAAGSEARAQQVRAERDATIQAALDKGKITPATAGLTPDANGQYPEGSWRRGLDEHPEATAAALNRLEEGKYPGSARATGQLKADDSTRRARVLASFGLPTPQEVK